MSQGWLSVIGILIEAVGFLMVAKEWYHVFKLDELGRRNRIEEDYERTRAEEEGREYHSSSAEDHTMWREFQRLLQKDIKYRTHMFFGGAALILIGMFLQLLGSWPRG